MIVALEIATQSNEQTNTLIEIRKETRFDCVDKSIKQYKIP